MVVAAVLQLAAAVVGAIAMDTPQFDNLFRQRLLQAAQGANAFTAVLLLIAVGLVVLFDYFMKDGDTRLPSQWRPSVLWGVALFGVLVVLLNIADIVNVGTASFGTRGGFRVREVLSALAALTLASAALLLAWGQLKPPPSVAGTTSGEERVEEYLS
jgi:hypothetical protein